jgi:YidC/Oxa1 family membrane protein insertase
MWQAILEALFQALKFFEGFTRDWGLAIILMTVTFRLIIWPLTTKQVKSTANMQKLQPLMKEVQEKYADDKQKQSEEMMKLYKEQNISPLSGCLPMLLQMPLLIAFYSMLSIPQGGKGLGGPLYRFLDGAVAPFLEFIHLPGVKAAGFLPDIMVSPGTILKSHGGWNNIFGALPSLWPYLLILVLFAAGSLIPLLITPTSGSAGAQQKNTGIIMSLVMLVIGFQIPAGALLYYDVSTLFAAGQQFFIQKRLQKAEQVEIAELIAAEDRNKKGSKKNKGAHTDSKSGVKKK